MSASSRVRSASALPVHRPGTWLRVSEDETVIVDPESAALHVVNDTALALWDLCNGENSVSEMVTAICELFGESQSVVLRDVERTLARFDSAGLLDWTSPKSTQVVTQRDHGRRTNG